MFYQQFIKFLRTKIKKNYNKQITKLSCPLYKMSQPHTTETFTIQRLRQIARAQQQDQDKYLTNIQIHKMNRLTFNQLKTNVDFLDSNDEKENKLKNLISATFPTQEQRLQLEQKRQQDKKQQNQKNKSDYVTKVLTLVAIYIAGFYTIASAFFKTQYTSTGEQIPIFISDVLVGTGCQIILTIIVLVTYSYVVKQIKCLQLFKLQKKGNLKIISMAFSVMKMFLESFYFSLCLNCIYSKFYPIDLNGVC